MNKKVASPKMAVSHLYLKRKSILYEIICLHFQQYVYYIKNVTHGGEEKHNCMWHCFVVLSINQCQGKKSLLY